MSSCILVAPNGSFRGSGASIFLLMTRYSGSGREIVSASFRIRGYRIIVATVFALALTLGWMTAAHAASPFDTQYGSPTAPVSTMTDGGSSGSDGSAGVAISGSSADTAVAGNSADIAASGSSADTAVPAASSGTSAVIGLLPDTGGSLFVVVLLGTALVGTGLLLLRRTNSN